VTFPPTSWRTSTYSGTTQSECVEVAPSLGTVGVRDSKNTTAGHLAVSRANWQAFLRSLTR